MSESVAMGDTDSTSKTDLLHPLATLHWEHCCWDNLFPRHYPRYCAVLHDRVAILTVKPESGDVLHISSSTDLHSWTTTTLPYQGMSLTTYQFKFVAVGGVHPSTRELSDLLFTSDTGQGWRPSLPPMPTKRSITSSVSTRSPEVLVVAGGSGSGRRQLDVVEVLLGDQWSTVDPLPAPCWHMHSTLHDGTLCFIGCVGQSDTVYTCSCASLIAVRGESSINTTTDRPLWRQFNAPGDHTTAVSYSSRLVNIDRRGTIRAYSSVSQSWVEASSVGRRPGMDTTNYGAAAVLPTGELVYAQSDGGVYRVKLSVSSYDADSKFISNVLSRLEVVMGIQIVSVLANIHSQLTTTSGVQLQPQDRWGREIALPDPQRDPGQYVEEVISQWSAGRSHRPPTWRQLLEVLQDVGLLELSQQIESFMKGLSESRTSTQEAAEEGGAH